MNKSQAHAVSVNQVSKRYGSLQALNQVDFSIQQGEFFGLLGPNGAGKSTLINALAGLTTIDSGTLCIMGHDVHKDFRQARQVLGVVPQEVVYDPFFNVRESLVFQSGYYGIRNNDEWIDELLDSLNLVEKQNENIRHLSGGMKRRMLIAMALVHKPQVLVLDEPTAGVDVELRQSMYRFIKRLHQQGHTIVLTTHYLEEAEELCERIAIIDQGQIITLESKQDLLLRGLGSKQVIRADEDIKHIPEALADKVLHQQGNELQLTFHGEQDSVMSILDALRSSGIDIQIVSVVHDSLEDIFVQLTSRTDSSGVKK